MGVQELVVGVHKRLEGRQAPSVLETAKFQDRFCKKLGDFDAFHAINQASHLGKTSKPLNAFFRTDNSNSPTPFGLSFAVLNQPQRRSVQHKDNRAPNMKVCVELRTFGPKGRVRKVQLRTGTYMQK